MHISLFSEESNFLLLSFLWYGKHCYTCICSVQHDKPRVNREEITLQTILHVTMYVGRA